MKQQEAKKVIYGLLTELKSCSLNKDLQSGRRIHAKAVETQNDSNVYVVTALIKMYAKCGSMIDARYVFESIHKPDVVSWNFLLLGYAESGDGCSTLLLFSKMKMCGCAPNSGTYVAALKACTSLANRGETGDCLERGRELHTEIGFPLDRYVQSALIDMYVKCGSMVDAHRVFDSIKKPNVVCWTSLLLGYAESGEGLTALELFSVMKVRECAPDSVTYVAALKACTSLAVHGDGKGKAFGLQRGREIHLEIGQNLSHYVQNTLIDMYSKCGSMQQAHCVFDCMQNPDVVSWNALLLGYVENGKSLAALDLFTRMKVPGTAPNSVTYVAVLKACTFLAMNEDGSGREDYLKRGREIHSEIGCHLNQYVKNTLIDMYSKCGIMVAAQRVFDSIQNPDVVSWNSLLLGYAESREGLVSLGLFLRMKTGGCVPNSVTYVSTLKACTSLAVNEGKRDCLVWSRAIHSEIGDRHLNQYVKSSLIDAYAKGGSMVESRQVFDNICNPDVISWNALILGYAENGEGSTALQMFSTMKVRKYTPNYVTYAAALKACISLAVNGHGNEKQNCLKRGREIHSEIGCHLNLYVQNTLMDMYAKCGSMEDSHRVFDSFLIPDVVSWNVLLWGYLENGEGLVCLELFSRMKEHACTPDSVTYMASLKACTSLAMHGDSSRKGKYLDIGREIHSEIGSHLNHYVQNTLIDTYAKCGSMVEARHVFDCIRKPDEVSWNRLLLGYTENGDGLAALNLFSRMKELAYVPNSVTYVAVIKACAILALNADKNTCLQRGRKIHSEIGCHLNLYVQNTLIDMYSKCSSMVDAQHVFDSIYNPDVVSWNVLLFGYADNAEGLRTLELFSRMKAGVCVPDSVTYIAALKACGLVGALTLGRKFHLEISNFTAHVVTCLVDFYSKCGSMIEAREVFDLYSRVRDISTWNALLAGYSSFGGSTFSLFEAMQDDGFRPNAVTFVSVLLCCSHAGLVEKAREYLEAMSIQHGVAPSVIHYNCMIDVLGRANKLNEAIALLYTMPCKPDAVTWRSLLSACCKWENVEIGRLAFQSLVDMDKKDASAYVLMSHIYGSKGMLEEQARVLQTRMTFGV